MNGKSWLSCFKQVIESERKKASFLGVSPRDSEWTRFMQKVMDTVGEGMKCTVTRLRPDDKSRSGEYLTIDVFFFDKTEGNNKQSETEYGPFVLPQVIVELENSLNINKISHCLWKIICIRAPLRVLICYQGDSRGVQDLRQQLGKVTQDGGLMRDATGDLLVIIGNESVKEGKSYFKEVFSVFEWRNDRLEKV